MKTCKYLSDFSAHKLDYFSRQLFIIFGPVAELAVASSPEREDAALSSKTDSMLLSTRDEDDMLISEALNQRGNLSILEVIAKCYNVILGHGIGYTQQSLH